MVRKQDGMGLREVSTAWMESHWGIKCLSRPEYIAEESNTVVDVGIFSSGGFNYEITMR